MRSEVKFSELVGKTLVEINNTSDFIKFITTDGEEYLMSHHQDCCESVYVEDMAGDVNDLLNTPITMAEESCSSDYQPWQEEPAHSYGESFTWTFYKLATVKGYVTIRWLGESNGYYSESVSFEKV